MTTKHRYPLGLAPSLLPTESEDDFYSLYSSIERSVKPTNSLEELGLFNYVTAAWDERRFSKSKTVSLKLRFAKAIPILFERVGLGTLQSAAPLAKEWLETEAGKAKVKVQLGRVGLDESAIEAVAIEVAKEHYSDADKLQASAANQRHQALEDIIAARETFAKEEPRATEQAADNQASGRSDTSNPDVD
jgi:hypothetical protein